MGSSGSSLLSSSNIQQRGSSLNSIGGAGYTKELYFDPEADKPGEGYWITDTELRTQLRELVDATETILRVEIYRGPLYWWQLSDRLMYHAFIVFETEFWWWSIEKNDAGITLQRSKRKNSVLYDYRRQSRIKPVTLVLTAKGRGSVSDLVDFLWKQDHLNRTYHFLLENCKYFAAAVFNQTNSEGKECVAGILDGRPADLL